MIMTYSITFPLKGAAWTIGAYGVSQLIRLVTNVVLTRLLAPELFGIMLIVYSLRFGLTLISDIGIGQNIVYNKNADDPDFYNTAWSLEIIRNAVLWLICLAAAAPMAHFYQSQILVLILPISALSLVFTSLSSTSRYLLQKRMELAELNIFETIVAFITSVAHIAFAYFNPTIWALVFGGLFGSAASMIGSYFLRAEVRQRFYISKEYGWQILHFGKWIFLSSIVYFLSMNFDRLYLAKVIPLELLGVYGIARSISELLSLLFLRLGNIVLFPFIASHSQRPRSDLREQLSSFRARVLLLIAVGFSIVVATADWAIKIIFDERYQAASWMLPVLIVGSWFSILATLNESMLLGVGKPSYGAVSNGLKFGFLLIGLPISVEAMGVPGGILIIALSDLCRYVPIIIGQVRERLSFGMQDLLITLAMFPLIGLWEWLRWLSGLGTSFESLPIEIARLFGAA
jgi:O-antigen/teichoic acid export membrane protein